MWRGVIDGQEFEGKFNVVCSDMEVGGLEGIN